MIDIKPNEVYGVHNAIETTPNEVYGLRSTSVHPQDADHTSSEATAEVSTMPATYEDVRDVNLVV